MNNTDVADLYRYNSWANERMASAILALPHEAFTRRVGGSYPSISESFSHIVSVEWVWLERWHGTNPTAAPSWASSKDPAELVERMRDVDFRRATFLAGLSEDDLRATVSFALLSGTRGAHRLRDLLVHVANHSTYHRGQLASMLRQVGAAPPPTDFLAYRNENPAEG